MLRPQNMDGLKEHPRGDDQAALAIDQLRRGDRAGEIVLRQVSDQDAAVTEDPVGHPSSVLWRCRRLSASSTSMISAVRAAQAASFSAWMSTCRGS